MGFFEKRDWVLNRISSEINLTNSPVAILQSRLTASAGELIVISFTGRSHTRTFGENTFGVTTINKGFLLSDGAILN